MSVKRSKERSNLCVFTFTDGRRCTTPRRSGHPHLCYFHARKEAQALAALQAGEDISSFLSADYLSACDLSSAMARLFSAVAQGVIKPKTASTLAYLGQTLVQSIKLAQDEYINAFGTPSWRRAVASSFAQPDPPDPPSSTRPPTQSQPAASKTQPPTQSQPPAQDQPPATSQRPPAPS